MRSSTIGSFTGLLLIASFAYSQGTAASKEKENCPFVAVGGTSIEEEFKAVAQSAKML